MNSWDLRKLIKITWASLSISSVSSVACTYMWSNGVGTVSIHMTRKISCTFVNIWEMTGFQSRFLEYDTCINLLILNIGCISFSCFRVGLKIFIFYHWSKILRQGWLLYRNKQKNKQTNQEGTYKSNKQTKKQKKPTFLKVITRQLPVQFRPSPLNPNKQVHTKDPFVFWQEAFRWQSWVSFWHSSISKKKGREKNNYAAVVAIIVTNQLLIQTKPKFPLQRNLSLNAIPNCSRVLAVKDRP